MENAKISRLFTELSKSILDAEEKALITDEYADLTMNDIHVIDAIGEGTSRQSSIVAKSLGVTMGTLTKAIDSLVRKGYVRRDRSQNDKRVVMLSLMPKGSCIYERHTDFHNRMMQAALSQFRPEETAFLEKSLDTIQSFFINQVSFSI